jgi:CRP/FNR family transcriptional regulator, cyclic AMP receptor protein
VSMSYPELLGYVGSFLMFSTFYMKTMIPLRVTAIAANGCMIVYTALSGIYPVLILQSCLLPLNIVRLVQMQRLVTRVKESARGDFRIDPLLPFMKRERAAAGEVLFREGDTADKMYLIQRGRVRLLGIDKVLESGDVMGEIGVLSAAQSRTATAVCEDDVEVMTITRDQVAQLYYQNPDFGFYLLRLVTERLLHNLQEADFDVRATLTGAASEPAR